MTHSRLIHMQIQAVMQQCILRSGISLRVSLLKKFSDCSQLCSLIVFYSWSTLLLLKRSFLPPGVGAKQPDFISNFMIHCLPNVLCPSSSIKTDTCGWTKLAAYPDQELNLANCSFLPPNWFIIFSVTHTLPPNYLSSLPNYLTSATFCLVLRQELLSLN